MEIISQAELDSTVTPLLNSGITEDIYYNIKKGLAITAISQKFDYLRLIANPYSQWFCIEPMEVQQSLANASHLMGDRYIYLSFVGYDRVLEAGSPMSFKFLVEELMSKTIDRLKWEAEELRGSSFLDVLVYSPQLLWATFIGMDCYGTIGMNRDFLNLVRNIYPQLDEELDKQLFDFLRWYHDNPREPDEWEYIPGDSKACRGWSRSLIEYLCRRNITTEDEELDDNVDLIAIYRSMKV